MADGTWETVKALGTMPVKLYHVGRAAARARGARPERPDERRRRRPGRRRDGLGQHEAPVADRFFSLLLLLAGLNLFLGLFNLVPLPPFDGGRIAARSTRRVRRGIARLRGRPDPGLRRQSPSCCRSTYVMAGVILVMSVVLIYADIVAPVSSAEPTRSTPRATNREWTS